MSRTPLLAETFLEITQRPLKSGSEDLFSVPRASKSAPRGFQQAFLAPSASTLRFGPPFAPALVQKGRPWGKSKNFVRRPQSFMVFPFPTPVASGIRFWTFPGSVLGAFWPSRWLKPLLELLLDRPRAVQDYFFSVLMPSKSAPRGLQDRSKRSP